MEISSKNKKIILVLVILTIIFTFFGSTLAYLNWQTSEEQKTNVVFTLEQDFWCAVDGGGDITSTEATIAPTTCTNSTHAIKREITVTPTISRSGLTINMDLWLDINRLDSGLSNSINLKYALTTSSTSCTDGVISSGNFNSLGEGDQQQILNKNYSSSTPQKYYLWIWLDADETSTETMDQSFSMSISGICADETEPESPTLDEGMIPVTIANDGTTTTIAPGDLEWYNYDTQQWANAVLVTDENRDYYANNLDENIEVSQDDILAYYTWIPRYSYKIPKTKCSSIPEDERNMTDYPECYAPYTMSDTDKELLATYYDLETWCDGSDEAHSDALLWVDYALENGRFVEDYYYGTSIVSWVNAYNAGEVNDCGSPSGTITLTAGSFNGNNSLIGTGNETSIDIEFEATSASLSNGDAVNTYYTHPAFVWDGETIAGIWVGKFETSTDKSSTCYTSASSANCNNTTQSPRVLPNVYSLRYQYIGNQFATSQVFSASNNPYGLSNTTTDAHMMKNSEWGAAAYLSHSIYGINEEVRINNNSKYTTGCGASTANASSSSTCQITYGQATSYPQSTTGNITGIFDMSGGSWEYVMGNYDNTANSTYFPTLPDNKYYNVYLSNQFTGSWYGGSMTQCTLDTCGGHALSETMSWYNDYASFVDSDNPWF